MLQLVIVPDSTIVSLSGGKTMLAGEGRVGVPLVRAKYFSAESSGRATV